MISSNTLKKEPTTLSLKCRLHVSSAGGLSIIQVEPHTVLSRRLVALRPVEVDEHVEGKFLSVDGADGA